MPRPTSTQPIGRTTSLQRVRVLLLLALASALLPATAAHAESACLEDPAGDVEDIGAQQSTDLPQADILAACAVHSESTLEVSVRVAQPTDPATDPAWEDFASAVGAAIDIGGEPGEEFDLNYGRFPDGVTRVEVFISGTSDSLCVGEGRYDGVRYTMVVPRTCLAAPDGTSPTPEQISVAPFIFFTTSVANQDSEGFYDEAPANPDFIGPLGTAPDPETAVQRLAGPSRVDTAIAVSRDDFADGGAGAVVLARADLFPDALVAAPLAVAADGPLLLTPSSAVAQVVEAEIQRVLPAGGTVYLSGGPAALSEDVRSEIEALGYTVERAAGPSRYATAVAVAEAAEDDPPLIVVADGNTFPDALIGGSLAASAGGVEILSNGTVLDESATAYLQAHPDAEVVAIGAAAAQAVPDATAIVGADPFATAVAVAQDRYPDADRVAIASGTSFPDGLTGGAHAGRRGIPLLLSWPDVLPDVLAAHLESLSPVQDVILYGGPAALSHQVALEAEAALG